METVLVGVVGAELRRLLDHLPVPEFAGDRPRRIALPTIAGLDAEQVVAAAAVLSTHDRLAPAGFQGRLRHQVTRIDTNAGRRFLGHRQHGVDELVGGTEGFLRRRQRNLRHGATVDLHAATGGLLRVGQPVAVIQRTGASACRALRQRCLVDRRGCGRRRRHQPGQQTISQLRRQCQASLIDQSHVIAMTTLARLLRRMDRSRSPQWTLAIDPRQRPIDRNRARRHRRLHGGLGSLLPGQRCSSGLARRQWLVLRHLAHQHVRQADTTALAGHGNGQLLVVHFLVLLGRRRVHRIVLSQRFGCRAHGLEHLTEEQRFELLRHLAHVAVAVLVADLELIQTIEVRIGARIAAADQTALAHIHDGRPQITIRSACRAPACFSASRMAIRSPGAAPT
ncbi:hypothetical protein D3C75_593000 [compost metagenome]